MWPLNKNIEQPEIPSSPESNDQEMYNVRDGDGSVLTLSAREIVERQKEADREINVTERDYRASMIKDDRANFVDKVFYKKDYKSHKTKKLGVRLNQDTNFAEEVKRSAHAVSPDMFDEAKEDMEATTNLKYDSNYSFKNSRGQVENLTYNELQTKLQNAEEEAAFQQTQFEEAMVASTGEGDKFQIEIIKMKREYARTNMYNLKNIIAQKNKANE